LFDINLHECTTTNSCSMFLDQILGPTMLKWLCPTSVSHLKDGVNFPTLRDNS
jgi:hypothetical protein